MFLFSSPLAHGNKKLVEDFHSFLLVKNRDEIKLLVQKFVNGFGFGGFLFSRWVCDKKNPGGFVYSTITDFPDAWMEKYYRERFYLNDPALAHCHKFWYPLPWTSELFKDPKVAPIHEEACLYGVSAGCAIPIAPDCCGFSYVRDQSPDSGLPDVLSVLPSMKLLTGFLMEGVNRIDGDVQPHVPVHNLTKRELECVRLMAAGFRDLDISERLNITFRTVVAHISSARLKMNASNRSQLVAKAVALNLV